MDSGEFWRERRRRQHESRQRRKIAIGGWLFVILLIGTGAGLGQYGCFTIRKMDGGELAQTVLTAVGRASLGGLLGLGVTLLIFIRLGFNRLMEEVPGVVPKNPYWSASLVGHFGAVLLAAVPQNAEHRDRLDWTVFGTAMACGLLALAAGWAITHHLRDGKKAPSDS